MATELRSSLLDYLRTTFKLQDPQLESALFDFLQHPEHGLFRGPYVDVRLPFVPAPASWRESLPLMHLPSFTRTRTSCAPSSGWARFTARRGPP